MPKSQNPLLNLTPEQYLKLQKARWKARTDLGWLCRTILNYPDVSDDKGGSKPGLHTHLIETLQKFPVPNEKQFHDNDQIINGKWAYTPIITLEDIPGKRRTLILDFRASLKTTINSIGHAIQWIINYPDIAILVFMGQDTKATDVLQEIKGHFQYNPLFRELFPDHCPQKSIGDWGRADRFTSEGRNKAMIRKEPTVMTGAIEKGAAGYHFDVIKFSDIVDENNISGEGLSRVRNKFDVSINLLRGSRYWMDVEGTRYHFGDVYGKIIERELLKPPEERAYSFHLRSIFRRNVPGGETYTFDDMKYPFVLDDKGKRISWWPEKWPTIDLEDEERNDPVQFSMQKLNWPIVTTAGFQNFPVDQLFPKKILRSDFEQNVRVAYKEILVDMGETDSKRANYTAIIVGTVDHYGRLYVEEIHHGRFLADTVVQKIFDVAVKHYRHLKCIKFEECGYTRGLMPSFTRELDKKWRPRGINFTIETVKRGNRQSKEDRIAKSLQPWYKNGDLRFLDDIFTYTDPLTKNRLDTEVGKHLIKELEQFPACETDDILDALADFLSNKDYFGRENNRFNPFYLKRNKAGLIEDPVGVGRIFKKVQERAWDKWLQIEDPYDPDNIDMTTSFVQNKDRGIL